MISIVQAPRASAPYPWAKFAAWMAEQGLSADEFQTMLENGAEPAVTMAIGCVIAEDVPYPGLPSLEGMTLDVKPAHIGIVPASPAPTTPLEHWIDSLES